MNNIKMQQPRKTTFMQRFEKAVQFYDQSYHLQKSTYKGLSSFYKSYSQIERTYAESLISLSKQSSTQLPQLQKQPQSLITTIKQILSCIQGASQLHFNFAERLMEVSAYYGVEYQTAKKNKDNVMKIIKDRSYEEYGNLRDREKDRNVINIKEKEICALLYNNLDRLSKEENSRIHNIKEQTIIYFSLFKKVCQKQLQLTTLYNLKLIKQQLQQKLPKISKIAEQLRTQHNEYGGQQIQRKSYDLRSSMIFNRESIRASMEMKERRSRLSENQDRLKKILGKYQEAPDRLVLINGVDGAVGLFQVAGFGKEDRRRFAREVDGRVIRLIACDMLEGYMKNNSDSDQQMLLQLIKSSLKYKPLSPLKPDIQTPTLSTYLPQIKSFPEPTYLYHIRFLQQLSKYSNNNNNNPTDTSNYKSLQQLVKKRQRKQIGEGDVLVDGEGDLSFGVKSVLMDLLLEGVCGGGGDLVEGYVDFMVLVGKFGEKFFGINKLLVVVLVLRKIDRMIAGKTIQLQLQSLLTNPYFLTPSSPPSPLPQSTSTTTTSILNNTTTHLLTFYSHKTPFISHLKILLILQKFNIAPIGNFNARDHFYACIRCAGFNYLKSSEECLKIFQADFGSGQGRLREIVQGVQELDYGGVVEQYLDPASVGIAKLLGVGEKKVRNKLFDQFTQPLFEIIHANLALLSEHDGVDREGYVLRLGIILAKLDLQNPQPINEYQTFFKVLKAYLEQTQKDYDNMLEHSRKTELWIMQQNSLATPNCIDFCSLLYKPFQFLLISLKQLQKHKKTQYTQKYSEYIKLRLNTVLKTQIIKYINFLYESLLNYRSECPRLVLKPMRTLKLNQLNKQNVEKQKQGFKELTRRLFNLLFLKEQLEEMIADFIQPDVYREIGSIFHVEKVKKLAAQSGQFRDILDNTREIVEAVLVNEEKIVRKVAGITVFYYMSKLFQNLYFQQQKNAIQQFFSNSGDYKLSEYTFLKYQQPLQDWFTLVIKNIPQQFFTQFSTYFSRYLYEAIQYEVLNSTKFKLPLKQKQVLQYLDSDITFVVTTLRQKFFDAGVIQQELKMPFKFLLADLEAETTKLMTTFEASTLKNDKDKCRYVLTILNLRVKDEKAIEFVKKYKSILS